MNAKTKQLNKKEKATLSQLERTNMIPRQLYQEALPDYEISGPYYVVSINHTRIPESGGSPLCKVGLRDTTITVALLLYPTIRQACMLPENAQLLFFSRCTGVGDRDTNRPKSVFLWLLFFKSTRTVGKMK